MVVFTCGHCGESVQKPKVEKHYLTKCRNRTPNLSCMDCFKDFLGNDYDAHSKCITEEQRYAAKGFVAKEKKGEVKQNTWVEMVQSVLDEEHNAPASVLRILNSVSKHTNTPRKKPKFVNFVKNVCGHKTNPKDIDAAWDLIAVKLAALSNNQNNNRNQKQDDSIEESKENVDTSITPTDIDISNDKKELSNGKIENDEANVGGEKKTKKQRKEEKKRKKYEAALQSAAQGPGEEDVEEEKPKKDKKKNRNDSNTDANEVTEEEEKLKMKRKRQDTVASDIEVKENGIIKPEPAAEVVQLNGVKTKKKKPKVDKDADESVCLHDQNVANGDIEEEGVRAEKFNWHAVIMSVLEKKGNELPFKRLQKKVLSEYSEVTGQDVDDRIADKFIKKLKSAPRVRVDKNRVMLVQ